MGLFGKKKIATNKDVDIFKEMVLNSSQELKTIINNYKWNNKDKVNMDTLNYALFMYDLDFYRQVMTLKYSKFYIETCIRTIFISFESTLKEIGNNIADKQFFNMYVKLSNSLHQIADISLKEKEDMFLQVALYLMIDELSVDDNELTNSEEMQKLAIEIAAHFENIINMDLEKL